MMLKPWYLVGKGIKDLKTGYRGADASGKGHSGRGD
jgi:hypothetical protein